MNIMNKDRPITNAEAQDALEVLLGISREPIGIRLLKETKDWQESKAMTPERGLPYCTAVAKASQGKPYKLNAENMYCTAGANALHIVKPTEDRISGKVYERFGVYRDPQICTMVAADMVYIKEPMAGVEIMPLKDFDRDPDIVILVANPKIMMRIVQGYAYHFGQLKNSKMTGMCALCQECTSYPYETGDMNISLLCAGTRSVGRWDDFELAAGIPFAQFMQVVDGIQRTVNPMEDESAKLQIAERAAMSQVPILPLDLKYTYYKGCYGPVK